MLFRKYIQIEKIRYIYCIYNQRKLNKVKLIGSILSLSILFWPPLYCCIHIWKCVCVCFWGARWLRETSWKIKIYRYVRTYVRMYVFHWLRLELRCPQRRRQRAAADFVYTMQIHIQLHIVLLVCVGAGAVGGSTQKHLMSETAASPMKEQRESQ